MKIFSRKAIATAAAAGFLTAGAFAAPAMAQTDGGEQSNVQTTTTTVSTTPTVTETSNMPDRPFNEASSGPEGEDGAGRFQEWMKLVTAVIGILTAVIGLASQAGRLFL